jgi:hypothetical protein
MENLLQTTTNEFLDAVQESTINELTTWLAQVFFHNPFLEPV